VEGQSGELCGGESSSIYSLSRPGHFARRCDYGTVPTRNVFWCGEQAADLIGVPSSLLPSCGSFHPWMSYQWKEGTLSAPSLRRMRYGNKYLRLPRWIIWNISLSLSTSATINPVLRYGKDYVVHFYVMLNGTDSAMEVGNSSLPLQFTTQTKPTWNSIHFILLRVEVYVAITVEYRQWAVLQRVSVLCEHRHPLWSVSRSRDSRHENFGSEFMTSRMRQSLHDEFAALARRPPVNGTGWNVESKL